MTSTSGSRGIRNNNPGNIRWGDEWQGLVLETQRTDKSFCQFKSAEYGIRAMIVILRNYKIKHGLNTIRGIISRWAPSSENNTDAYISSVSKQTGIDADKVIDVTDSRIMTRLLEAIITHENGSQPYDFATFTKAFDLAS